MGVCGRETRRAAISEGLGGGGRLRGAAARFLRTPSVTNCRRTTSFGGTAARSARAHCQRAPGAARPPRWRAGARARRPPAAKRPSVRCGSKRLWRGRASCASAAFAPGVLGGVLACCVRTLQVSGTPRCAFKSFSVCFGSLPKNQYVAAVSNGRKIGLLLKRWVGIYAQNPSFLCSRTTPPSVLRALALMGRVRCRVQNAPASIH